MPHDPVPRYRLPLLAAALVLLAATASHLRAADPPKTFAPDTPAADASVLRFDPVHRRMVPITKEEIRPGYVYSHVCKKTKRRVWSYVQADGTFWHAFGPGTTIEAPRFDLKGTRGEILEQLEQVAPDLAKRVQEGLRPIRFTLDANNQWFEAGNSRVLSIFDADTGRRWEKHWSVYLPVRSLAGDRWTYDGGGYLPASPQRTLRCIAVR